MLHATDTALHSVGVSLVQRKTNQVSPISIIGLWLVLLSGRDHQNLTPTTVVLAKEQNPMAGVQGESDQVVVQVVNALDDHTRQRYSSLRFIKLLTVRMYSSQQPHDIQNVSITWLWSCNRIFGDDAICLAGTYTCDSKQGFLCTIKPARNDLLQLSS
jgi:hypothetical protein